jgi:hypothetical protein
LPETMIGCFPVIGLYYQEQVVVRGHAIKKSFCGNEPRPSFRCRFRPRAGLLFASIVVGWARRVSRALPTGKPLGAPCPRVNAAACDFSHQREAHFMRRCGNVHGFVLDLSLIGSSDPVKNRTKPHMRQGPVRNQLSQFLVVAFPTSLRGAA